MAAPEPCPAGTFGGDLGATFCDPVRLHRAVYDIQLIIVSSCDFKCPAGTFQPGKF